MSNDLPNVFPSSMLTGIAAIDDEHRALFARIKTEPKSTDPSTRSRFLKAVVTEFAEHFAHEEKLMAEMKFAHAAGHAKAHARLLNRLRGMLETTEDDRAAPRHDSFEALDALFRDALHGDAEFANWVEFMKLAPAQHVG
jgi:hemerythrin-like metal-binding protein